MTMQKTTLTEAVFIDPRVDVCRLLEAVGSVFLILVALETCLIIDRFFGGVTDTNTKPVVVLSDIEF